MFQRKAIFDDYSFVFEYDGRKYESFVQMICENYQYDVVIAELHKKMNYFTSDLLKLKFDRTTTAFVICSICNTL